MSNKKYRLLKDLPGLAEKGQIIEWSEESQLEYAKIFGKADKWNEVRDYWLEEVIEVGMYSYTTGYTMFSIPPELNHKITAIKDMAPAIIKGRRIE